MSVIQGTGFNAVVTPSSGVVTGYTASLLVAAPDATTTTPTVTTVAATSTAPGYFQATVPAVQLGNYQLTWTLTGSPTQIVPDQFTSIAPSLALVNLATVKSELLITNDVSKDGKLRQWIREATRIVETITGPVLPLTRTYIVDGGIGFLVLPDRYIVSITSVTENNGGTNYTLTEQPLGSATSAYAYTWDRQINKIVRRDGASQMMDFADGDANITVVYIAGMTAIPDDIQRAASLIIHHWYEQQEQPYKNTSFAGTDDTPTTMVGSYQVPYSVMELLEPYRRTVGIY